MQKPAQSGIGTAEQLAIDALSWLAGEPDALARFLALSGIGPGDIRQAAKDPAFLCGVLDFFVGDEPRLMAFAADAGIKPERIVEACRTLGGSP